MSIIQSREFDTFSSSIHLMPEPLNFLKFSSAAGITAAACWGISTVITKSVLATVPPLPLLTVQLLASNLLLWTVIIIRRSPLPTYRQALQWSLPGLLQPGLSFSTAIAGLALTTASVEALVWSLETVFIIGLAGLLLREQIGWPLIRLSFLGVLGVGLVTITTPTAAGELAWLGNLLILVGTFCAALYTVLCRRTVQTVEPLLLTALNQIAGLLGVCVILAISLLWSQPNLTDWSFKTWLLAAVSGIMLHALPFWLYNTVLKQIPASLAAFFLTLIPLFTIGGAYLFLGETLSVIQWVGAGLILAAMTRVASLYG